MGSCNCITCTWTGESGICTARARLHVYLLQVCVRCIRSRTRISSTYVSSRLYRMKLRRRQYIFPNSFIKFGSVVLARLCTQEQFWFATLWSWVTVKIRSPRLKSNQFLRQSTSSFTKFGSVVLAQSCSQDSWQTDGADRHYNRQTLRNLCLPHQMEDIIVSHLAVSDNKSEHA